MSTNWEKLNGTFNYQGVLVTKDQNGWTVFNRSYATFGEVVLQIQNARAFLFNSIK